MRRLAACLSLAVGLTAAAIAVPGSTATIASFTPSFTESEHTIAGAPGPSPSAPDPRHCSGTGGSCLLAATLFLPDPLPASPVPAILMQHGFPGDRQVDYVRRAAELYASEGYAVLSWDARGFGSSQGYVMLDSPAHEGADVSLLIDWLAARSEVALDAPGDPRVGMYGQSYGGGIQFLAAALDDRVDVLVARESWHSLVDSLAPNGIIKAQWVSLLYAAGQAFTEGHLAPELTEWLSRVYATNEVPADVAAELHARSHAAYHGQVDIPTFLLQGERDTLFNLTEASRNLAAVAATGAQTKLFWYWGGHGGYANYPGGVNRTWTPTDLMESRQLAWLDRYLGGDTTVDTGPMFEYFDEHGVLQSMGRAPKLVGQTLTLGAGGEVAVKPVGRACPPTGAPTCSYTEASNFSSPGQPGDVEPSDVPGTFVALDTAPLTSSMKVVGDPRATIEVTTATGQDVSLFLKVFDVDALGNATLINRLVTPLRASSGTTHTIDLAGFAHTFEVGHRLRLVVATTDAAYFGTDLADIVTLSAPVTLQLAR
ncbi:MAG TPA: alpha/beta fold hydrolase [Nitriliruptorales bacterium]